MNKKDIYQIEEEKQKYERKIKEELPNEDIIQRINKYQNNLKNLTEILNEDEKHDKKKKQNYQSFDSLRKRRKNKDSKLSNNVKKIMTDVGNRFISTNLSIIK